MYLFISGLKYFSLDWLFYLFLVLIRSEISKGLGKSIRAVKDATEEVKSEIKKSAKSNGVDTESIKKDIDDVKDKIDEIGGSIKRKL